MSTNPLVQLQDYGQSVWMDFIRRDMLTSGELANYIRDDGIRGVTSNPAIFEKAIAGSQDYDEQIRPLASAGKDAEQVYEALTVEDVRLTADLFRPLYDQTGGGDGYVSLEVNPHLANGTRATIEEARHLWKLVDRPNVMIKIPSTKEGLPAMVQCLSEGININATLLFGLPRYREVAEAYIQGLEQLAANGKPVNNMASVASFFLSRIDVLLDPRLEKIAKEGGPNAQKAQGLIGEIAIANAKLAYAIYKEIFSGDRFRRLREKGARAQRLLWASTSTKNPAYSDVKYVEPLIGRNTVNTMPLETIKAYRDHGQPAPRLEQGVEEARQKMQTLAELGIDIDQATQQLEEEGVQKFNQPYDQLVKTLQEKMQSFAGQVASGSSHRPFPGSLPGKGEERLSARLWHKDASLWEADPASQEQIRQSLGWLDVAEKMEANLPSLQEFARQVRQASITHVVHMGMGGSSLAPLAFSRILPPGPGGLPLTVLDSTAPGAVLGVEKQVSLEHTLFIEASKSGTTAESRAFGEYFYRRVQRTKADRAGENFAVITDEGSPLARLAGQQRYRRTFLNYADIGGRYSALSYFGLVPAVLMGTDVAELLRRSREMMRACGPDVPDADNPGVSLGRTLGELALQGRDKVTFLMPAPLETLGMWLEQLLAESTGKNGKGLIPVAGEPLADVSDYSDDRVFVYTRLRPAQNDSLEKLCDALRRGGHPVITLEMGEPMDLGREFFRWEVAIAIAGAVLGINPFDQPNVQESKDFTNRLLEQVRQQGRLVEPEPSWRDGDLSLFASAPQSQAPQAATAAEALRWWFGQAQPGDYLALMAYLNEEPAVEQSLQRIRRLVLENTHMATTLGYGPRFLHSTGQLHKGGPNKVMCLQLTADLPEDTPVPGQPYTFGIFQRAQAAGDMEALRQHSRRVMRVHLGTDVLPALAQLQDAVQAALSRS